MNKWTIKLGIIGLIVLLLPLNYLVSHASQKGALSLQQDKIRSISSNPIDKYYIVTLNMDVEPIQFDTVTVLYDKYIQVLKDFDDEALPIRYIAPNPYFYKLAIPLIYYNSPVKQYGMQEIKPYQQFKTEEWKKELLPYNKDFFTQPNRYNTIVDRTLMAMYIEDASNLYTTEDNIMQHELYIDKIINDSNSPSSKKLASFLTPEKDLFNELNMIEQKLKRPNWWYFGGEGSLQITQNYFSANWYKGGESNSSVLGNLRLFGNYNDQNKLQIENVFEAKLGFNTVPSDTLRSYRVNTDLIRFSSKIGLKATNKWFYTLSTEVSTQFSRSFKKNSSELMAAFMTPFNFNASLGMDFKQQSEKINFSLVLSPASYSFKYLRNKKVNPTHYGIKEGRSTLHDVGSKVESNLEWQIIPSIRLKSRLTYFTNYSKVIAEWENTFDFILNRYLSTKLFFHGRLDDSAKRFEDHSYFQLQELLSIGINYRW